MPLVRKDLQVPLWQLQAMPRLQDMSVFQLRPVTPSYAALLHNPPKLRCMAKINGTSNQIVLNKYTDGQVHNKYRYTRKASVSAPDQKLCNVFRVQNGKQSIMEKAEENLDGYEKLGYKDIAENRTPVASLGFGSSNQSKATQEQNLIDQNGNIITDNPTDSRNVQTQKWVFGNMGCESDVLSNGNTNKCTSKSTSGGQYTSLLDINANRTAVSNTGSIQEWDHSGGQKKCSSESNGTKNHQRHIGILNVPPIFIGNTSNLIAKDTEKMSNCINNGERTNLLASQEDSRQSLTVKAGNMSSEDRAVQRDHVLLGSVQEEGFCRCKDQTDFLVISKGHYPSRCLSCKGLTPCKCEKKKLSKSLNPDTDDQRSHLPRNNKYFLCETCGLLMHIANAQSVPDKEVKMPDCVERYPRKSDINVHHTFEEMPVSSKPFQENDHTFSEPSRLHAEPKVPETQILHSRSFSLKPLTGSKQYTSSRLDNGTLPIPEGRTNFFVLKSPEVKSTKYKLTTADAPSTPYKVLSSDEKGTAYVLKLSDGKTASYRLLLPDKKSTSFELLPPARKIISSCQPTTPDEKCTTFVVKFSDGKSTYAQLLTPGDKGTNFVLKLSDGKSIRYHLLKPDVGDEKGTSFVLLPLFERCTYYKLPSVHRKCTSSKTPTLHKGKPASPKQQNRDAKISILNLRRVNGKHTDSKMKSTDNEKSTSPKAQRLEDSLSSPSQLELLNTEKDKCEYSSKTEFIKMHHLYIDFPEENLEETRFFQASGRKENTDEGDGMVANPGQTGYRKCDQISAHLNNNLEQPLIGLLSSLTEEKDCAGDSLTNSASVSPPRHSVHYEQDKYALLSPDSEESDTESPLGKTQRCDKICARKGQRSVKQTGKGIRTKKGSKISGRTDLYSVTQLNRKKGTERQCGRIDKEKGQDLPQVLDIHLSRKQRSRDKASRFRSFTTNQKQNQPPSDNLAKLRKTVTKTGTTGDGSFLYGTTSDGTFLSGITDDGIFLSGTTGVGSFLSGSNKLQKKNGRSSSCFSTKTDGCHSGRSILGFSSSTPSMFGLCKFTRLGKDTLCDVSHSVLDRNINNKVLEIVPKSNNHCRIQKEKQFSQRRLAGNKSDSETSMAMESRESAPEPNRIVQEVKRCDPGSSIFVEPRLSDPGQNKATELMSDPAPIKDTDYSRGLNNGQSIVRELKGSDSGQCKGGENKIVLEMKEFDLGSSIIQESRGSPPEPSIVAESRESNHGSVISKESRGSKTGPDILREANRSDSGKILTREIKSSDQGPSIVKEPKGSDSGPSIVRGSGESDTAPSLNREIQQSDAGSNMATESTGSDTKPCLGEEPGGAGSGPRIFGGFERSNPDQDIHHRGYMEETMPLSQQAKSLLDEGIEDSIKFRTLYPHMYSVLMDQGLKDTLQSCALQDSPNPHAEISSTSQDLRQVNDSSYINCNTDTSAMNEMYAPMDVCTKRNIHPPHHNNSVKNKLSASNNKRISSVDFFSKIILQDKRVLKAQVQKLCKTISYLDDVLLRKYRQDLLDVTSLHTCRGLYHYKRAPKFSYIGQKIIHPKRRIIRILKKKLRPALIHKLKERIQTHKREGIKQKNQILSTFSSVNGKEQQAKKRVKSSFGLVNMVQRRIKAQKKQRTPRQKCTSFIPQNTASQVKTSDMELTEKVTECQSTYLLDKTSVNEEVEQQSSASKRLEVKEHATGAERSEVKGQETFSGEEEVLHSNIRAVDGLEKTPNGRLLITKEDKGGFEHGREMASDDQQNNCSGLVHNKLPDSSTQVVNSVVSTANDKDYQMLTQADQIVGDLQDKSNELSIKECFCHMHVDIAQDLATTDWSHNEKSLSVLNPSLHHTPTSHNPSAVMTSGVFDNKSPSGASYSQICLEQRKHSNDIYSTYEPGIQENEISSHWDRMLVHNKGSATYWGCGPPSGQQNMVCTPHTKSNVVNCSNMVKKQGIGFVADTRKPESSFMQQMLELVDNVMGKIIDASKTSAMCDQDMTVSSSCETVDNISNVAEVVAPLTVDKAPADHVFSYSDISEDDIGLCGEVENSGSDPEDLEYMEDLQYGQQF